MPSNGDRIPFEEFFTANPPPASSQKVRDCTDSRKATNDFQCFKDDKFTGDINESIELTLRAYNVCARRHSLTAQKKTEFIVNVLGDLARTFFFNNARSDMSFDEMEMMTINEYNSNATAASVRKLEMLPLDNYMAGLSLTTQEEALTKLVELVGSLTPQCQPQFRSDANKINLLRRAVLDFSWFLIPMAISSLASTRLMNLLPLSQNTCNLPEKCSTPLNATIGAQDRLQNSTDKTCHQKYGRHSRPVKKFHPLSYRLQKHFLKRVYGLPLNKAARRVSTTVAARNGSPHINVSLQQFDLTREVAFGMLNQRFMSFMS